MSNLISHPIPAVVILLGILVFVHEFGHYITGRLMGIAVEVFSIGFGPRILGWTFRGTDYRLSIVPLGGFVKFAGAHPTEEVPPGLKGKAFRDASLLARALTVAAGPIANFVLAASVFALLGYVGIPHPPAYIGDVIEDSRAAEAGLRPGDKIKQINGEPIKSWRDLEHAIATSPEKLLNLTIDREGHTQNMQLTPLAFSTVDVMGRDVKIGRAGIALGTLAPIIGVLGPQTAAAEAGLVTGDRISEIRAKDQVFAIKSYFVLQEVLSKIALDESAPKEITLVAQTTNPPSKETGVKAEALPTRSIILNLRELKQNMAGSHPKPREILAALGISDAQLVIANLPTEPNTNAGAALKPGDLLLSLEHNNIKDIFALRDFLIKNTKPVVDMQILRAGQTLDLKLSLDPIEVQKPEGKATIYSLPLFFWGQPEDPNMVIEQYDTFGECIRYGVLETSRQIGELSKNVYSLITGEIPLKALGGPMLIAKVAGDSAKKGWQTFLGSMALISVNLGLLNLFPIPVLDGGQLVLLGVETLRRRPIGEIAIENFQKIGFAMILALVVLATYNDLSRFWLSMLGSVAGLFN